MVIIHRLQLKTAPERQPKQVSVTREWVETSTFQRTSWIRHRISTGGVWRELDVERIDRQFAGKKAGEKEVAYLSTFAN